MKFFKKLSLLLSLFSFCSSNSMQKEDFAPLAIAKPKALENHTGTVGNALNCAIQALGASTLLSSNISGFITNELAIKDWYPVLKQYDLFIHDKINSVRLNQILYTFADTLKKESIKLFLEKNLNNADGQIIVQTFTHSLFENDKEKAETFIQEAIKSNDEVIKASKDKLYRAITYYFDNNIAYDLWQDLLLPLLQKLLEPVNKQSSNRNSVYSIKKNNNETTHIEVQRNKYTSDLVDCLEKSIKNENYTSFKNIFIIKIKNPLLFDEKIPVDERSLSFIVPQFITLENKRYILMSSIGKYSKEYGTVAQAGNGNYYLCKDDSVSISDKNDRDYLWQSSEILIYQKVPTVPQSTTSNLNSSTSSSNVSNVPLETSTSFINNSRSTQKPSNNTSSRSYSTDNNSSLSSEQKKAVVLDIYNSAMGVSRILNSSSTPSNSSATPYVPSTKVLYPSTSATASNTNFSSSSSPISQPTVNNNQQSRISTITSTSPIASQKPSAPLISYPKTSTTNDVDLLSALQILRIQLQELAQTL